MKLYYVTIAFLAKVIQKYIRCPQNLFKNSVDSICIHTSLIFYRYIDDIIMFNINSSSDDSLPVTYPNSLEFTKNSLINNKIHYLDVTLILINKSLLFNLYDKKFDFSFQVNNFTYFDSCLHLSIYRNILINQFYRVNNICSAKFKNIKIKETVDLATKNNYPLKFINSLLHPHN